MAMAIGTTSACTNVENGTRGTTSSSTTSSMNVNVVGIGQAGIPPSASSFSNSSSSTYASCSSEPIDMSCFSPPPPLPPLPSVATPTPTPTSSGNTKNRNSVFEFPQYPNDDSFLSFPSYFSSSSPTAAKTIANTSTKSTMSTNPNQSQNQKMNHVSKTAAENETGRKSQNSLGASDLSRSSSRVTPNLSNNYDYKSIYSNDSVNDKDNAHENDNKKEKTTIPTPIPSTAGSSRSSSRHDFSLNNTATNPNFRSSSRISTVHINTNIKTITYTNPSDVTDGSSSASSSISTNSNSNCRSPSTFNFDRFLKGSVQDLLERAPGLEDIIKNLQADGSHLWKVRSTSKWFRRKFNIDINDMSIRYEPTYKYNTCSGREKRQIELGEIIDIRKGWKTDTFNAIGAKEEKKRAKKPNYKSQVDERACFSIIYGPRQETLDLVAPNDDVADRWVRALQHLVSAHKSAAQEQSYEIWLRRKFNAADIDKNKCLSFPETMKLLKHLNITMEENKARELFNEANTRRNAVNAGGAKSGKGTPSHSPEVLDEDEFVSFYFKLLQRPELEKIFGNYAQESVGFLSANELCQFLQKEQGDSFSSLTVDEAKQLINIYEQAEISKNGQLSLSGFTNMLLSPKFDLFNQSHRIVWQDMSLPLCNYYIAASHNTYLIGNQLSGTSSVEGYVDAFKRGCRCVELDCWDGDDDEPIIYHGYTLTTKIRFKEVLADAVKPYAFATSQYPVILGLENHCSEPYQKKMVQHLKNILGDMLYSADLDTNMENLPSPDQLKCKVIIRGKKRSSSTVDSPITTPQKPSSPVSSPEKQVIVQNGNEEEKGDEGTEKSGSGSVSTPGSPTSIQSRETRGIDDGLDITEEEPPRASMESLDETDDSDMEDSIDYIDGEGKAEKKKGVSIELSNLVNILQGVHFHSFEDSRLSGKPYHSSSFAESKALKLISESGADFVDYNRRHVSKVFPAGSRTTSSNFNPMPYWTAGCQLVTLNYQTEDMPNFYNTTWFSENGTCGFVLKPEILRNPSVQFNPNGLLEKNQGIFLTIRVISGQHLPKAPGKSEVVDPYVELKVNGLTQDKSKHQTKVIRNNGFNPLWDERFQFRIRCPELAVLLFRVYDYSQTGTDATLAHYGLPLSSLTTGYRHVHLTSMRGVSLAPSSLFVHVNVTNMNAIK